MNEREQIQRAVEQMEQRADIQELADTEGNVSQDEITRMVQR